MSYSERRASASSSLLTGKDMKQGPGFSKLLRSPVGSALVFVSVACYLWAFARTVHGLHDEGLALYPAERILLGQIPYRHFFSEFAPGTMYLQALWFEVLGI